MSSISGNREFPVTIILHKDDFKYFKRTALGRYVDTRNEYVTDAYVFLENNGDFVTLGKTSLLDWYPGLQ